MCLYFKLYFKIQDYMISFGSAYRNLFKLRSREGFRETHGQRRVLILQLYHLLTMIIGFRGSLLEKMMGYFISAADGEKFKNF